ncbi:hypothetical protein GLS40_07600 [Pseudooceanicola sp. 216_PA32_1]|uniref:Solute-binding protein family 5 domain-containing protein n=1 Tax=Pseudooceanicola pacificus TaxID=2676438 RepID=A0A844WAB9_9RHOB|nr:ABC transporter substrate-binding protein [Pseudooceanicola pacificus]MWB77883.1 hypothetical protein [Pseudooceanicola pacificus]
MRRTMTGSARFAALMLGAAVLATSTAFANEMHKGGTLTFAISNDIRGFDSVKGGVLGQAGETVMRTMQEPLLNWNPETGQAEPLLATEWSASDDQLVWTFKLREGVKFHDGSDFDAGDVAAHYNRILDPEMKSRSRAFIEPVEKVVAVDPLTVEFHLKHVWQGLLPMIATTSMSGPIPAKENVEADAQQRHPVGTGPFRFVDWMSGDRIVVERNPDYWAADEINLDTIVFRVLPDNQTRFASLKSGEVDMLWTDRGNTINEAKKVPGIVTLVTDGAGAATVMLNAKREPLSDPRLRAALAHAWNQEAVNKISWQNTRPNVTHPLGPDYDCGDAGYRHFDLKEAKRLVDEYKADKGVDTVKVVMVNTATPRGRELGEIYQQTAAAAGIEMELVPYDSVVKPVFAGDWDVSGWRIADGPDMGPQLYGYVHTGSSYNLTGFNDPALDALSEKMRVAPTREERLKLQCDIVEAMNRDGSILYRGGGRYHVFTRDSVKNVPPPYKGVADVTRAWLED